MASLPGLALGAGCQPGCFGFPLYGCLSCSRLVGLVSQDGFEAAKDQSQCTNAFLCVRPVSHWSKQVTWLRQA